MAVITWQNRIVGTGEEQPDQLLANPRNFRTHPKHQQDALEGVLNEVGWVDDVIVNRTTGHIIDGHLRVSLALRRNEPSVPVKYVELTEAEEALILATFDPIAALAVADKELLEELLHDVSTGEPAIQQMLSDLAEQEGIVSFGNDAAGLTDPDDVPEPPVDPITKPGDLWTLGRHRLLCGDSTNRADVDRLMNGEKADMVFTDPPYGMNLDTDFSTIKGSLNSIGRAKGTKGNTYDRVIGDDEDYDPTFLMTYFSHVREQFWFGADYYAELIPSRKDGSWLVWDKRKESQADAIGAEFELCWSKQKHKRRMLRHDWFGFLSSDNGADARNRVHPTQKPITLIADILTQWGKDCTIVVDPYLGSGTTLIAAEQQGRACYGMEISPAYCDVIVQRWENYTGQTASREPALHEAAA